MFTVSRCEPARTFDKKDGSGEGKMQKVVLRDDVGKDYKTTVFSTDEAFVGDIVEATLKEYNEKFKEYQFTLKAIKAGSRAMPTMEKEPRFPWKPKNGPQIRGGLYVRVPSRPWLGCTVARMA